MIFTVLGPQERGWHVPSAGGGTAASPPSLRSRRGKQRVQGQSKRPKINHNSPKGSGAGAPAPGGTAGGEGGERFLGAGRADGHQGQGVRSLSWGRNPLCRLPAKGFGSPCVVEPRKCCWCGSISKAFPGWEGTGGALLAIVPGKTRSQSPRHPTASPAIPLEPYRRRWDGEQRETWGFLSLISLELKKDTIKQFF